MLTVISVLKSGGDYDESWVKKLKNGVSRNLKIPHKFKCLSDVDVEDRVPLEHEWPGWWSKIELFKPNLIDGPTLYLDLDTVLVSDFSDIAKTTSSFAMLNNFNNPGMVGSGVMWFKDKEYVPHKVYEKFKKMPECYIQHHERMVNWHTSYIGDQAFIWDALDGDIETIEFKGIKSYKRNCSKLLPADSSIVCFHGRPRPSQVSDQWVVQNWI